MKIKSTHRGYDRATVKRVVAWAAKQIGLEAKHAKPLTVEVGYRKSYPRNGWNGWYRHREKIVQVFLPFEKKHYPANLARTIEERKAGWEARDEWELFVSLLSHELEHARSFAVAKSWADRKRLNQETRVRAVDHRVLEAFRASRDALLAEWVVPEPLRPLAEVVTPTLRPKRSFVEQRAERAEELLADWERRLKLAKTKVSKYRRKVKYYQTRRSVK